jgi:hypothetical protein
MFSPERNVFLAITSEEESHGGACDNRKIKGYGSGYEFKF